jgi:hypothetical protein
MNERSVAKILLDDLPRIAREENWNGATIKMALAAIATMHEIEEKERATPAPDDERKH